MSVATDLAALYAEPFLTCPVQAGTVSARGFFDEQSGQALDADGQPVQVQERSLTLATGALALAVEDRVTVGAVGAVSAAGGRVYVVRRVEPIGDGLETRYVLTRVAR